MSGKPRIGIWHEICTDAQEHRELKSDKGIKIAKSFEGSSGIPMSKSMGPPRSTISKTESRYTHTNHITPKFYGMEHRYKDMGYYALNGTIKTGFN